MSLSYGVCLGGIIAFSRLAWSFLACLCCCNINFTSTHIHCSENWAVYYLEVDSPFGFSSLNDVNNANATAQSCNKYFISIILQCFPRLFLED